MVAVGDEGLVPGQLGTDAGHRGGVGHRPQAVAVAVLRGRREQRRPFGRAFHQGGGDRRHGVVAAVRQEQGLQVRPGRPHECRAVGDDVGHDVLVRQDHPLGRVRDAQGADDAALQQALAVALFVDVQTGFGVGGQDALRPPAPQGPGGLLVARLGRGGLGEDQADDVVRVGGLEVEQAVGADHDIVGRGGHGGQAADPVGVVAEASERGEFQAPARRCFRVTCRVHPGIVRVSVAWGMIGGKATKRSDAQ